MVDRPVGLLEAGASAGLCLFPDRWSYRWDTDTGPFALTARGPTLAADVSGPAPLPDRLPEVPWRGGIDLNPLDVTDPDTCRWLLTPHRPTPGAPRCQREQGRGVVVELSQLGNTGRHLPRCTTRTTSRLDSALDRQAGDRDQAALLHPENRRSSTRQPII